MQTFLPYKSFIDSASVLDMRRLGKQRCEAYQLITLIEEDQPGWKNHPARLMWVGYTNCLRLYLKIMISEWIARGYKNTIVVPEFNDHIVVPPWLGDEEFHSSHRATLLHKNYEHYKQFNWPEEPRYNYHWPVTIKKIRESS